MSKLEHITSKASKTEFDNKVLGATQHLQPYVKHRIYIAETKGILPKNMYKSADIIDDGIAELYMEGYNVDAEAVEIKLKLFKIVDRLLERLLKKESFHQDTMSTDRILKEELDRLKEDFTVDADLDLILNTELDDISYHQDTDEHIYVYTDRDIDIIKSLDIADLARKESQMVFKRVYSWLPLPISDVVDLYAFGKLSFGEIAEIRNIEEDRVKRILKAVKQKFSDHLN